MFALWSGVAISLHEVLHAKNVIFPVSMRKPWISYGSCQCNEHEQTSNHNFHCGPNGMVLICELYPMRNSHAWPNLLLHVAGSGLKTGSQPAEKDKTGPDSSGARGAFFHCSDLLVSSPFCSNCLLRDLATLATLAQLSTPRKKHMCFPFIAKSSISDISATLLFGPGAHGHAEQQWKVTTAIHASSLPPRQVVAKEISSLTKGTARFPGSPGKARTCLVKAWDFLQF